MWLPTVGVGTATLQVVPEIRPGTALANVGSSTETSTDRPKLADHAGTSVNDLPELPMNPLNAYGPSMCTRRSSPERSAWSSAAFGWIVNPTGYSVCVGVTSTFSES